MKENKIKEKKRKGGGAHRSSRRYGAESNDACNATLTAGLVFACTRHVCNTVAAMIAIYNSCRFMAERLSGKFIVDIGRGQVS